MKKGVKITAMDLTYMSMAVILGGSSKSIRRKVGALIVDYALDVPRIVCEGINGTKSGAHNLCEDYQTGKTLPSVIHAEVNALNKLGRHGHDYGDKLVLYVTVKPCLDCTKKIIENGNINRIFYLFDYDTVSNECQQASQKMLEQAGIKVIQITKDIVESRLNVNFRDLNYTGILRSEGVDSEQIDALVVDKANSLFSI